MGGREERRGKEKMGIREKGSIEGRDEVRKNKFRASNHFKIDTGQATRAEYS